MITQSEINQDSKVSPKRNNVLDALILAAWFGLVTGLMEGFALWSLQRFGWLMGVYAFLGSSLEIVWISAAFDFLLFVLFGLIIGLLARLFTRLPVFSVGIYGLTCLLIFDGLVILIHPYVRFIGVIFLTAGLALWPARWLIQNQERLLIFCRRILPVVVGISALAFVLIQGGYWLREEIAVSRLPEAKPGSPNVVVIVIDTLRVDHLSSYGYSRQSSPTIDQLSKEGVTFENAMAPAPWTLPSHASLVTGRYPHEHGATDIDRSLNDRYLTIGDALQASGYRTGAFSANYSLFGRINGFGRGFHHFEDYNQSLLTMASSTLYGSVIEYYVLHRIFYMQYRLERIRAPEINQSLLNWIDHENNKPFFAFLNYYDVHLPYVPPQPYRSKFSQSEIPGGLMNTDWGQDQIYINLTPDQLQGEIDAYDGAIAYVDNSINQLMAELDDRNLLSNTLIIILSDHGEMFGEHSLFEHSNSLYREVIHVPMIFWMPGRIPANIRIEQPVSITALPATIQGLIDFEGSLLFPGPELSKLWNKPGLDPNWPAPVAEAEKLNWVPPQHLTSRGGMRAIINPQYKYIESDFLGVELFDWIYDPGELNNIAEDPTMQSVLIQEQSYLNLVTNSNVKGEK
jgi:arylsulfatase A-like enzyme